MTWRLLMTLAVAVLLLAACSGTGSRPGTEGSGSTSTTKAGAISTIARSDLVDSGIEVPEGALSTVSGPVSGNRHVVGSVDLGAAEPVDIALDGTPIWVVGVAEADVPTFVVALEGGTLEVWRLAGGDAARTVLDATASSEDEPPLVVNTEAGVTVVDVPDDASDITYPAVVGDRLLYITASGGLVIANADRAVELEINALPDTRISVSSDGLISVLAGPTDRYRHGVLGDDIEAGNLLIIDPAREEVIGAAVIDEPSVIEGIAAPWVDVDGDGTEELLVTISNADVGARLAVFDRSGILLADGPPIGRGNRWRNQLGAAPTGPSGEIEVIDVRVPHLGGVVEHFRLDGQDLTRVADRSGFTSHRLGSRNLDMAFAADVTGDGRTDVIVPTIDLDALGVITRTASEVGAVEFHPLPGRLTTNIAVVAFGGGALTMAVGTSNGVLRIYQG